MIVKFTACLESSCISDIPTFYYPGPKYPVFFSHQEDKEVVCQPITIIIITID